MLNKREFIEEYSMRVGVNKSEGARQVDAFISTLESAVLNKDGVMFVGHFSLKPKTKAARSGSVNGKQYVTKETKTAKFMIGGDFLNMLNG